MFWTTRIITDGYVLPSSPREFIQTVYVEPFAISGRALSTQLGVSPSTLNRVLKGRSGLSLEMALRLSKTLGRSAESWLAMQANYALWQARLSVDLDTVEPIYFDAA